MACLAVALLPCVPAAAAPVWPEGCSEATIPSGDAHYPEDQVVLTCMPEHWNGALVVYAHGFVAPDEPIALPDLSLAEGVSAPEVLMPLGFAFAATSFHKNGYAVEQAGQDLDALVAYFRSQHGETARNLVVGVSEGGLIATMQVERQPDIYDGGVALCGPLEGSNEATRYFGDFRVLFDAYFPSVFAGFGVVDVPDTAYLDWDRYEQDIRTALAHDPVAARRLFGVARVARGNGGGDEMADAAVAILKYAIGEMNDLIAVAGGNPYGNLGHWYKGSGQDVWLNGEVERVAADAAAQDYLNQYYRPSGRLRRPLVAMHTTDDEIVPFRHEVAYSLRARAWGASDKLTVVPVQRYGHCNFTVGEVVGAIALLLAQTGEPLSPALRDYLAVLPR